MRVFAIKLSYRKDYRPRLLSAKLLMGFCSCNCAYKIWSS